MYKVLIIEDEDMIRKGLRYTFDWLKRDCVVIGEAADGKEGLKKIESLNPDIVLLDVVMPVMDGITMLEDSKSKYSFSTIIISGYDEFEYAKKAIKLEVSEYLLKPVDHEELSLALEKVKEQARVREQFHEIRTNSSKIEDIKVLDVDFYENEFRTSKIVLGMLDYIRDNYSKRISIQDLVEVLDRSTTYLNQKFKDEIGYTFNVFLNRYRIQKSIEMIKSGEVKIYNIATTVGFCDYRYYSSVFKKYTGCLPSDFQEYFKNYAGQ